MTTQETYGQCEEGVFRPGWSSTHRCRFKATTTVANYQGSTYGVKGASVQLCTVHNPDLKRERRARRGPTNAQVRSGLITMAYRTAETAKERIKDLEQHVLVLQAHINELEDYVNKEAK